MKTKHLVFMGIVVLMLIIKALPVWAVPGVISFQGKLTDAVGNILNGNYSMNFSLYDSTGSSVWNETQMVAVDHGLYSVKLGAVTPLDAGLFSTDELYLGIIIDGEIISPRLRLTSVAFAMKADDAEHATGATNADYADSAGTAASAMNADFATSAGTANTADSATNAGYATSAGDADHAANADHAHSADTATTATSAANAGYAVNAGDSDTVDGQHASAFALAVHSHDDRYYPKAYVDALENRIAQLETTLAQVNLFLATFFQGISRAGNDITFSGVNVHVVNGTGTTYGTVNGFGNIIVGYNELRGTENDRTGSHNIVVGRYHNYSSYGGLVAGSYNTISGDCSSVCGGYSNTASGNHACVSGGWNNLANGEAASVSGGSENTASSEYASVNGGQANTASGHSASVSAGWGNTASGYYTSVSGGNSNTASTSNASVSGGIYNTASGGIASVSGGYFNTASGYSTSISGGRYNEAVGICSYVGGGGHPTNPDRANIAYADYSAILGGAANETGSSGDHESARASCISGGYDNDTSQIYSSVSGGRSNTSSGQYSTVSGGISNTANNDYDSVVGDQGHVYVDSTSVH